MTICRSCRARTRPLLDLGVQAIANRYLHTSWEREFRQPLHITQCETCAMVQIESPPPLAELRPRFPWIAYNEPEAHISRLADLIAALPELAKDSAICGVSLKDNCAVTCLRALGFTNLRCLDPCTDLGISHELASTESVPFALTPEKARELRHKIGPQDVIVVKELIEHAHELDTFMQALALLLSDDGYLVVEVPDCKRGFEEGDYSLLWEEHVTYFTPEVMKRSFPLWGLRVEQFFAEPYALEDALIVIARKFSSRAAAEPWPGSLISEEFLRAERFVERFATLRDGIRTLLENHRAEGSRIAVFGAGHPGSSFTNFFRFGDLPEFFVDDNPNKQGLFMPGSRLPIYPSSALVEQNAQICILALNPAVERKVVERNKTFVDRGGTFYSIYPASDYALQKVVTP